MSYKPGELSLMLSGLNPTDLVRQEVPLVQQGDKETKTKLSQKKKRKRQPEANTEKAESSEQKKKRKLDDEASEKQKTKVSIQERAKANLADERLSRTVFVGNLPVSAKEKVCEFHNSSS